MDETVSDTAAQPVNPRDLAWPDCYNARDLGGLPTRDGGTTTWRAVVRSDILSRLTPEGRQALLDYGVRTVIDLRGAHEVIEEPAWPRWEAGATIRYVNQPLERYTPEVGALIRAAATRSEVYCIILDHYPGMVAAAVRQIADARPGGVLIHCHAGKDRTGTVAALLLSLAGVPQDVIAADYAHSQMRLWPRYEELVRDAGSEEAVDFWLKPTATPDMMLTMLDHLATTYGGTAAYLRAAGLAGAEIDKVIERLRG